MHPLEQLRYLARTWGPGDDFPVQEAAGVLAELAQISPGALLQACRRLVEYFPGSATAWWLSARALSAPEPVEGIWDAAADLEEDPTFDVLARELPADRPVALVQPPRALSSAASHRQALQLQKKPRGAGAVVVVARAAGDGKVLLAPRALEALRLARARADIWVAVPRGSLLPPPLWEQLRTRTSGAADIAKDVIGPEDVTVAVGERGVGPLLKVLRGPTCPAVAELLGWGP